MNVTIHEPITVAIVLLLSFIFVMVVAHLLSRGVGAKKKKDRERKTEIQIANIFDNSVLIPNLTNREALRFMGLEFKEVTLKRFKSDLRRFK